MFTRSRALPTGHHREHHPTGQSALDLPRHGPRKEELPLTDSRFDALASCLLEGLRIREGGVSVRCRRWKLTIRRRTWWCAYRSLPRWFALRVHATHPYSRVSITPAFSMRTFRVISYNSGPNRVNHAHVRRIRRSISSERSALSWIMPPRYSNWVACLYLWPATSMTSSGARGVWSGVRNSSSPSSFPIPSGLLLRRQSR